MQPNIYSPDVGRNHGSIDVVDAFVIDFSFLTSEFWRSGIAHCWTNEYYGLSLMTQPIKISEHRTVAEI